MEGDLYTVHGFSLQEAPGAIEFEVIYVNGNSIKLQKIV